MNIGIIGIGGVGGYFGGKLSQVTENNPSINIYFIARNQHLTEIQKNGLRLDTDEGLFICKPTLSTDRISDLPLLDLCLICVKSYDLTNILIQLKPKIQESTMILPLLNGIDISERIRTIISSGVVFPSCVYVGTHIEKPGTVKQRGGACTIIFGKDPNNSLVNPVIFDLLKQANIKHTWMENPYTEIWSKFIFIAAFGLVTANFNKTIGEVLQSKELSGFVITIMEE
ncbi:MAG: 2-dehydropantoate 2-reductase, partial [Candidatus Margulisbacteria bacterium GWF2_35_9]